jgi:FkbM family methyltransferase
MLSSIAKKGAALLPHNWQQELKRRQFRHQIRNNTFRTPEPEWDAIDSWLSPGDWAIDVGANVGHYTKRFSDRVGTHGRVIAFEPVPATFELLAANVAQFSHANVTLLNLAASNATHVLGISIPDFATGLKNYYQAALTTASEGLQVMTCAIDSLSLLHRVALLKIDAEGHDEVVLAGARSLVRRDLPIVIIESVSPLVAELLEGLGYIAETLAGSPNVVYRQRDA